VIKSSEEAQKKKDFRGNEKDYSKSQAFLNGGSVMALKSRLSDDVSSSLKHG